MLPSIHADVSTAGIIKFSRPFRTLTQDRDDPSQLHMYFSGTEGIHADVYSTKPMEDFASANLGGGTETWTYSDLRVRHVSCVMRHAPCVMRHASCGILCYSMHTCVLLASFFLFESCA